jgi:hypothetical protein
MARVHCDFCHIQHPRPVGRNCLFRNWQIDSAWGWAMADNASAGTVVTSQEQVQPLTINPPVTSVASEIPLAPMGDNLNIDLPPLEEEIQRAEVLNSTTHSVIIRADQYPRMSY